MRYKYKVSENIGSSKNNFSEKKIVLFLGENIIAIVTNE